MNSKTSNIASQNTSRNVLHSSYAEGLNMAANCKYLHPQRFPHIYAHIKEIG